MPKTASVRTSVSPTTGQPPASSASFSKSLAVVATCTASERYINHSNRRMLREGPGFTAGLGVDRGADSVRDSPSGPSSGKRSSHPILGLPKIGSLSWRKSAAADLRCGSVLSSRDLPTQPILVLRKIGFLSWRKSATADLRCGSDLLLRNLFSQSPINAWLRWKRVSASDARSAARAAEAGHE